MKAYRGVDVQSHVFMTSVLIGKWYVSRPGRFIPRKINLLTHWIGAFVGPKPAENIFVSTGTRTQNRLIVQPAASSCTDTISVLS
jgi:hypothetical protein